MTPGLLAASALELIPRQPTRDRSDAADPRRRSRSPSRPEARALTSTENTIPPTDPAALEHAETGAPAPEQIEEAVEEPRRAPVAEDSPLCSDFDIHPDVVAALAEVGIHRTFAIQELTLPLALAG